MSNADYFVALGGNTGSVVEHFCQALHTLQQAGASLQARSNIYRSKAQGGPPQDDYLNAVVSLRSVLQPKPFLQLLLDTEQQLGRVRREHWGPRNIDLDLLAWGQARHDSRFLSLPHPRMCQRNFVMLPLCDIASDWLHPVAHQKAQQLLQALSLEGITQHSQQWPNT